MCAYCGALHASGPRDTGCCGTVPVRMWCAAVNLAQRSDAGAGCYDCTTGAGSTLCGTYSLRISLFICCRMLSAADWSFAYGWGTTCAGGAAFYVSFADSGGRFGGKILPYSVVGSACCRVFCSAICWNTSEALW